MQELKNKICELLKGSDLDPMNLKVGTQLIRMFLKDVTDIITGIRYDSEMVDFDIITTINNDGRTYSWTRRSITSHNVVLREAEVLTALGNATCDPEFALVENGRFLIKQCYEWDRAGSSWLLGKPLDEQTKETINFLKQILINK